MSENPTAFIASISRKLQLLQYVLSTDIGDEFSLPQIMDLQTNMKQMCQLINGKYGEDTQPQTISAAAAASSSASAAASAPTASSSSSSSPPIVAAAAADASSASGSSDATPPPPIQNDKNELEHIFESFAAAAGASSSSSVIHPYFAYFSPQFSQDLPLQSKVPSPDCIFSLSTNTPADAASSSSSISSSNPHSQLVCNIPVRDQARLMSAYETFGSTGKFVAKHALEKALNCRFDQQYFATLLAAANTVREGLDYFLSFEFVFLHSQPVGSFAFQRVRHLVLFLYCNSFAVIDVQLKQGGIESRRAEHFYGVIVQPLIESELKQHAAAEAEVRMHMGQSSENSTSAAAASTTHASDSTAAISSLNASSLVFPPFLHPHGAPFARNYSDFLRQIASMHQFLHQFAIASNQFIQKHTLERIRLHCVSELQVLLKHFPKLDRTYIPSQKPINVVSPAQTQAPAPLASSAATASASVLSPTVAAPPRSSSVPPVGNDGEESVTYIEVDSDEEQEESEHEQIADAQRKGNENATIAMNKQQLIPHTSTTPSPTTAPPYPFIKASEQAAYRGRFRIAARKLREWNYDVSNPRPLTVYEFAYLLGVRGWVFSKNLQRHKADRLLVSAMVINAIQDSRPNSNVRWEDWWDKFCTYFELRQGSVELNDFLRGYADFTMDFESDARFKFPIHPPKLRLLIARALFRKDDDKLNMAEQDEVDKMNLQLRGILPANDSSSAAAAASTSASTSRILPAPHPSTPPTTTVDAAETVVEDMFAPEAKPSNSAIQLTASVSAANINQASLRKQPSASAANASSTTVPAPALNPVSAPSAVEVNPSQPTVQTKSTPNSTHLECHETMSDIGETMNSAKEMPSSKEVTPVANRSVGSEKQVQHVDSAAVGPTLVKRELPPSSSNKDVPAKDDDEDDDYDDDDVMIIEDPHEMKSNPPSVSNSASKHVSAPSSNSAANSKATTSNITAPTSTIHTPAKRVESTSQITLHNVPSRPAQQLSGSKRSREGDDCSEDDSDNEARIHEEDCSGSEMEDKGKAGMDMTDDEQEERKQSLPARSYATPSKNTIATSSSSSTAQQQAHKRQCVESISVLDTKHSSPQPVRQFKSGAKPPIQPATSASLSSKQLNAAALFSSSASKPLPSDIRMKVTPTSKIVTKIVKRKLDVDEGNIVEDESKSNQPKTANDSRPMGAVDKHKNRTPSRAESKAHRDDMDNSCTEDEEENKQTPVAGSSASNISLSNRSSLAPSVNGKVQSSSAYAGSRLARTSNLKAAISAANHLPIKPKIEPKKLNVDPFANLDPDAIALRKALNGDDVYEVSSSNSSSDEEEQLKRQFRKENKLKRLSNEGASDNSRK